MGPGERGPGGGPWRLVPYLFPLAVAGVCGVPVWLLGPAGEPLARLAVPGLVAAWSLALPPARRLPLAAVGAGMAAVGLQWGLGAGAMLSGVAGMLLLLVGLTLRPVEAPRALILILLLQVVLAVGEVALVGGGLAAGYGQLRQEVARELDSGFHAWFQMAGSAPPPRLAQGWRVQRELFLRLFPGLVACFFLAAGLSNILLLNAVAGEEGPVLGPPFHRWRLPDHLVWLLIAAGAAALLGSGPWREAGLNLLLPVGGLYGVQGFSIATFHFRRRRTPRWFRLLFYLLMGLYWYGLLSVAVLGLAEVWFPLRPVPAGEDGDD